MSLRVNGREIGFVEGETLIGLMKRLNYVFPLVVVHIGGEAVLKSEYDRTEIRDGMDITILHLTSGG